MTTLSELLDSVWHKPNRQMAWGRILSNQVVGAASRPFTVNDDYVVVRLGSMFLKDSRVLWLKLSPLAHAVVTLAGRTAPRTDTAIIGPTQFGDLAAASAERSVVLNQRLSGPAVWRGGDLLIAAGLFAVPKDEAATALLGTLGQLAGLGIPGLKQSVEIARIVKSGVEGVIGLKGTKPILGVKDALKDARMMSDNGNAGVAAPCVLAGIAAPAADVDFSKLWVRDGRLWSGSSHSALQPYETKDHLLIIVERGPAREDWRGLPSLTPHELAFDSALRANGVSKNDTEDKMNQIFSAFDGDLTAEPDLTDSDKARIRGEVITELQERLDRKFGGVFGTALHITGPERRSVGGVRVVVDPTGFDFLAVGGGSPESSKPAPSGSLPFSSGGSSSS